MSFIVLQPTYHNFPLYNKDIYEYIDPSKISVSEGLKEDIILWSYDFNNLVDFENPNEGYIRSFPKRKEFIDKGFDLEKRLRKEIEKENIIKYFPILGLRTLELQGDYGDSPLIDKEPPYFIKMEQIPISLYLKEKIIQWTCFFKKIIDYENPIDGFLRCSSERKEFIKQGYFLQQEIIKELGPLFCINYITMPELRTLRLMADYDSLPLRDFNEPFDINIDRLAISKSLKKRLEDWDEAYVATLNQEYPPLSDFATPEQKKQFIEEGYNIEKALQEELKGKFDIFYVPLS